MSYVGIATSLGLVIEVPMVLRSLSVSLAAAPNADLPIPFDLGFIAMLDSGTNNSEFNRIVKSYVMAWWKGTRKLTDGGTLTAKNLEKCLEQHCRLCQGTSLRSYPMPPSLCIAPPVY